jgi:NACalpha-BTF3-like transcription factor
MLAFGSIFVAARAIVKQRKTVTAIENASIFLYEMIGTKEKYSIAIKSPLWAKK